MEFLITKTSDYEYKEIKRFENLKELLNFQKACKNPVIILPFSKSDYEGHGISKNYKIMGELEIYDDWRE